MRRLEATATALLIAGLSAAWPAAAQEPPDDAAAAKRLHEVESAIKENSKRQAEADRQVEEMAREIQALRKQMIGTAKTVQDYEEGLTSIEMQLSKLNAEAGKIASSLSGRRNEYAALLSALARFARNPPETALLLPEPPIDAVRGAMVLRATLPPVEGEIRSLSARLAELTALREKIAREQEEKLAATSHLKEEGTRLDGLIGRMMAAEKKAQSDSNQTAQRLAKLSSDAHGLKDLLDRIEAQRRREREAKPKAQPPQIAALQPVPKPGVPGFAQARGSLVLPARGQIVKTFGQTTKGGLSSKGITLATRAEARVVAPYDGQVAFAGPFRGYGQLLIIAQGEGYHILLAGLSRIDCVVGQRLVAGEPVGIMGPADNGDPQLYIELRHDGEPINPLPWMAAHEEKVKG